MATARMTKSQICLEAVIHIPDGEEASVNFKDKRDRELCREGPNQKFRIGGGELPDI